ncbi:hypothetical protein GTW43_14435 [Streptomyces sp. SID5785]|uniref:hypothetical protein n=1 Tax=Streptomyces sp. SID5785 TaxID=2690309 RepID=UPI0013613F24|nr:hypothetical protein [Streptomyces sp. SID5785]MZD06281.1 hypothetical protein [Streptomyces sp. SID5785]
MTASERRHCGHDELIADVVTRFDAYVRARSARDGIFGSSHADPRQEQRVFDDLQRAMVRLRGSVR